MSAPDSPWHAELHAYLQAMRSRGLSERTLDGRDALLRAFAHWCRSYGLRDAAAVTAEDIAFYAAELTRIGAGARPLAPDTRRNRLTAVR